MCTLHTSFLLIYYEFQEIEGNIAKEEITLFTEITDQIGVIDNLHWFPISKNTL